jgi:hypothetical protein
LRWVGAAAAGREASREGKEGAIYIHQRQNIAH